jgi:hypothetical protein
VKRAFDLSVILSATTGCLVTEPNDEGISSAKPVGEMLEFLLGTPIFGFAIKEAVEFARPGIIAQHPRLVEFPEPVAGFQDANHVLEWVRDAQIKLRAMWLYLSPIPGWTKGPLEQATRLPAGSVVVGVAPYPPDLAKRSQKP